MRLPLLAAALTAVLGPHCSNEGPHGANAPWEADETQLSMPMRRLLLGDRVERAQQAERSPTPRSPLVVEPVPLAAVRLANGSHEWTAEDTNRQFLEKIQVDSLLFNTRLFGGATSPPGPSLGGWESPGATGRGSFEGHWLSAASRAAVAIPSPELRSRVLTFIGEARRIQLATSPGPHAGFVGGMNPDALDDLFAISQSVPTVKRPNGTDLSDAPLYHVHKWLSGLLDAHEFLRNETALEVAIGIFDWLEPKMSGLIERHGMTWWDDILQWEYGGMNDALYELHRRTKNATHLKFAKLFDKPCFLGPLAMATPQPGAPQSEIVNTPLYDMHGNTHLPIMVGAAKRFEDTGEGLYKTIVLNFLDVLQRTQNFASGGSTFGEHWGSGNLGGIASGVEGWGQDSQETCTTYNALKVIKHAFGWTADPKLADQYEWTLRNAILPVQKPLDPGRMLYMLPHGPYMNGTPTTKADAGGGGGWSTWNGSYWCCTGTGAESFARLGEAIYFRSVNVSAGHQPVLYINQLVSSTLALAGGLRLEQQAEIGLSAPGKNSSVVAIARQTIQLLSAADSSSDSESTDAAAEEQTIMLRVPGWTAGASGGAHVTLNDLHSPTCPPLCSHPGNQSRFTAPPGSYVRLELTPQQPSKGALLVAEFGMGVRLQRVTEYRTACVNGFSQVGGFCPQQFYSIHVGPLLMVAVPCSNTTSLCSCQSPLNCTASSLVLKDQATMDRPWEFIERDEARMAGAAPGDLRLLAKGADGRVFPLRSLAFVVDEPYFVYLNISLASGGPLT